MNNIKCYGSPSILDNLQNKDPLFICVIATTKTSSIPKITGAGATPKLTDYTPAADLELLICGEPKCPLEIRKQCLGMNQHRHQL